MAHLIIVRHGKSQWNALGLWTGWKDISLHKEGKEEAKKTASILKDIAIHKAYSSNLKRSKETLEIIKKALDIQLIPTFSSEALNERNYGVLTGKNKFQVKKEIGANKFNKIRRGWNYKIEGGETLKDVYERVVPYFQNEIMPDLLLGKNLIIVAHGNSLRALVKYLENLDHKKIMTFEIQTAEAIVYTLDKNGSVIFKEFRSLNSQKDDGS